MATNVGSSTKIQGKLLFTDNIHSQIQQAYESSQVFAKIPLKYFVLPVTCICLLIFFLLVDLSYIIKNLIQFVLPLVGVSSVHFWYVLSNRKNLNVAHLHPLFCSSIFGELLGWMTSGHVFGGVIHWSTVILGAALAGMTSRESAKLSMLSVGSRLLMIVCLPWINCGLRSILCYTSAVSGVVGAKYVEETLGKVMATEGRLTRRRRTSNCSGCSMHFLCKTRRTSLPALGGSHKTSHHVHANNQGSSATVDVALLAEAHGLVTDMLADPNLPAHVIGGLRSLASLLAPPNHVTVNHRLRPGGASVSLADFNSGSDTEEIPYTGEKPSTLSKKFRRNLPPSLLRRMSTSTWTTTTSATGLPTLEPEPSRKRSTSFRHQVEPGVTSPTAGPSSPREENMSPPTVSPGITCSANKGRSFSTTSIPTSFSRRNSRDRKTVCSLHPLSSCEINALQEARAEHDHPERRVGPDREEIETTEDDEESAKNGGPLPPLPCIRRVNITSDYESSNESPGSSDNNDIVLSSIDDGSRLMRMPRSLAIQTCLEMNRCTLCGGRTKHGISVESITRTPPYDADDLTPTISTPQELEVMPEEGPGLLVDGYRYDVDTLSTDPLLNRINEWDYPIFELQENAKELVLSQMCFKVFHEVGLFEAFKIPVPEFLNYFHALEMGYRDKPYHNRMHAADVLQGVYFLTSQPIPGFTQIASDATNSPLHKSMEGTASEHGRLVHRPSFAAEVTYGVMGANFPALELMALYAAAAMHDYDHPGRTNAFLVSTYAPQAILYNDRSVLENHHAAAAWNLFLSKPEFNWLCHLDKAEFKRFRFLVIECILATDLKRHFEILAEFNAKVNEEDAPGIDWTSETDRLLAMEMCIKLADINGPCKRHDIHVQWTYRIAEEFYEQGDEEAGLGLQVSPFMDRKNPQLAKLQESFINHLVAPLCNAYGEAALLPGVWVESSESEDDEAAVGTGESSDGKDTEDETCDSDCSAPSGSSKGRGSHSMKRRKVACLQTQHLQENYEHWVNILKQEQLEEQQMQELHKRLEESELKSDDDEEDDDNSAKQQQPEDMETIHEEMFFRPDAQNLTDNDDNGGKDAC